MYHYYRRDHLGNNREVWQTDGNTVATIQRTQYYPSGLPWAEGEGASEQPYKYNDKEFIEMHGYDTYDYGARGMFPSIMRFTTMDPLAEKYYSISPYAYCLNNPVRFIDPDGRDPRIYVERKGFGHAFVTTGSGENTTVYTYGRYAGLGKDKSVARSTTPIGEGVLIKLTGDDAKSYIQNQLDDNEAKAYEFKGGSDELVSKHFDELLNSSEKVPTTGKYKDNENAKVVDQYNLFNNNCVTKSTQGVQKGVAGDIDLKDSKGPASLGDRLEVKSQKNENGVRKVSSEEIKKELNLE